MAISTPVIGALFIFILFESYADCSEAVSPSKSDDGSSIPTIASGKRMHNIMRFGKRPAGGHSLIHFGKRENQKSPQHSFLSFGKRDSDQNSLPNLIEYLQRNQDNSNKRGHAIMRFGKRSLDDEVILGVPADAEYGYLPLPVGMEDDKRSGHSMMYFGKRDGHNMMYFGKRAPGHSMLSFGKRDDDKRAPGHSMLSFGKRDDDKRAPGHSMLSFGKRDDDKRAPGHNMLSFGKIDDDKRVSGHNMLSFGKRDDDKRAHSMIHFGKRDDDDSSNPMSLEDKRDGHAMFHFGKRDDGDDELYGDDAKRSSHSMIHFGKRDFEGEAMPFFWNPAASETDRDGLYQYGKKNGKNNHAMIHFGKRDDEKRAHSMIHFGKRSVEEDNKVAKQNHSESTTVNAVTRLKRDLEAVENPDSLSALVRYGNSVEDEVIPEEDLENAVNSAMYYPARVVDPLSFDDKSSILSIPPDYPPLWKKDSKNMFLRFG